jgi:hypothetical protein
MLLAAALTSIVLFPIVYSGVNFPFLWQNAVLVFAAVILFKHIFFLKHSWLDSFQKIKIALIPFSVAMIFVLMRMLNVFTRYIDEMPLAELMDHLSFEEQSALARYIKVEYVTSAVVTLTAAIIFPIRMLVSIWREVNQR